MGSLNDELIGRISDVITRAEEMIYKENNILFPICVQFFSHEDWLNVYREIPNYDPCLFQNTTNGKMGIRPLKQLKRLRELRYLMTKWFFQGEA